jgi:hypothetical protein
VVTRFGLMGVSVRNSGFGVAGQLTEP